MQSENPFDPLARALEMMRNADTAEGEMDVDARLLNVQRAQAYALIGIAESLQRIMGALESRDWRPGRPQG